MTHLLSSTGNLSFALYGFFIVLTVVAMVVAFRQIMKGTIPADKLDKMIDLFKYAIVSTAIATTTLIVSNLFKEREQDVKELEYFDKYAGDVKLADNILVRLQLSKYFSIVAPEGDMKTSWKTYYDTVVDEYARYLSAKGVDSSKKTMDKLIIDAAESPLASSSLSVRPSDRFVVNNTSPDLKTAAEEEQAGYKLLMNGDYDKAAAAFTRSENAKNQYHASYELARLLRTNATAMSKDARVRAEVLKEIEEKYSGYASAEVRAWLKAESVKSEK